MIREEIKYPLTNPIVFSMVMRDEILCRELIEKIFPDKKIRELRLSKEEYLETEKTILNGIYNKSVRLDVLFEGLDEWFDIEMQMENRKDIPKRSRYYHSTIDTHILAKGKPYTELKPCYVIFICPFDPFGQDKAVYTFEKSDRNCSLPLNDEAYTIIVNTKCSQENIPDSLKTLFAYLNSGVLPEEKDTFIDTAHQEVKRLNQGKELIAVMTLEEELKYYKAYIREQALQEGLAEGLAEGLEQGQRSAALEMAKKMLADGFAIEQIQKYTNLTIEEIRNL